MSDPWVRLDGMQEGRAGRTAILVCSRAARRQTTGGRTAVGIALTLRGFEGMRYPWPRRMPSRGRPQRGGPAVPEARADRADFTRLVNEERHLSALIDLKANRKGDEAR
jgi:hypothetical protein